MQARAESTAAATVPRALSRWFVFHFWADLVFAVPLFVAPRWFLGLFGWTEFDPIAARIVAAALFGIGIQSLIGRGESPETFRAMLNLKVIWSGSATLGIALSVLQGGPPGGWLFVAIFGGFHALWLTWWLRLRRAG
jgi:hypothetical protein